MIRLGAVKSGALTSLDCDVELDGLNTYSVGKGLLVDPYSLSYIEDDDPLSLGLQIE